MTVSKVLYMIAAGLSLLGAIAHELLGAPKVLAPLAESGLPDDIVWLHHFSWHVGTVAVLAMVIMFLLAVRRRNGRILAVIATAMSAGFAGLGIGLAVFGNAALWSTPAPYPWTLIALIGAIAVIRDSRTNQIAT